MKKFTLFGILFVLLFTAGCGSAKLDEAVATQNAMAMQMTLQANEMAGLRAQLAQPTATCEPCVFPTPVPTEIPEPTATATPISTTPLATPTTAVKGGSLSGTLQFPAGAIPALRIVAMNTVGGYYHWQNTVAGQTSYRFDNLDPGTYWVMAYDIAKPSKNTFGAYTEFVPCGMSTACSDHTLIAVEVKEGQETKDVNPSDWYADAATWGWPIDPTIKWD